MVTPVNSTYYERKAERAAYYQKHVFGWKQRTCSACNGSGRYDHNRSPWCEACNGTGRERYKPSDVGGKPTIYKQCDRAEE